MAVVILDGRVRATWATTIANVAAPTTAELNAGTALEGFITPDGLNINVSTNGVDTSNLGSTFTTMRAGRKSFDISLTIHHDGTTDTGWNLFPYRTNGYLIVRMGIDKATAWTAADKVKVYPLESAEPSEVPPKPDSVWDFTVQFFLTSDPNTRAVVA